MASLSCVSGWVCGFVYMYDKTKTPDCSGLKVNWQNSSF